MFPQVQGSFFRKLTLTFCATLVVAMGLTGILVTRAMRRHLIQELSQSLLTQARLIESQFVAAPFARVGARNIHELAHRAGLACGCRVTVIGMDGRVLGDSELSFAELARVENHKDRPEVQAALGGRDGSSIRHSHTIGVDLLYAAAPLHEGSKLVGVARVALPLTQVKKKLDEIRGITAGITAGMILLAVLAAFWISHSLAKPVLEMSRVAQRLSDGDLEARVTLLPSDEHGQLGRTLNSLAQRIQSTVRELSSGKAELAMILSTMVEAVVAVDADRKVLAVNPAFSRLLNVKIEEALGRPFYEVLRQAELSTMLQCALGNCKGCSEEIRLFSPEERIFEAVSLPFSENGKARGALLVLHEITRLRKLEQMRRDFVANVSHELRTPLASIKGSAETLRSGALDKPAARVEFVEAIEEDADRLTRLVDDLLDLSAIESGRRAPQSEPLHLLDIARDTAAKLKAPAERHKVALEVEDSHVPVAIADKEQMRQVFVNLIDNAIKFNREGGKITVTAEVDGRFVTVAVKDTGIGIPSGDLSRIFERFYRVDKARSRELGGTGLGLSIVKHIVEAHGGVVAVESAEGQGSTFRFSIPAASAGA